jgi:hypothetical protein
MNIEKKDLPNTPPADSFQIRCPRLGHQIYFSYCRQESMGNPCPRTLDCWYTYFDVTHYFKKELSDEEWEIAFVRPVKPKMVSLMELLDEALKNAKGH